MSLSAARTVADAVLYEGYLLYPYRATSSKNQVRWQFGMMGPPGAVAAGVGEEPTMHSECLLKIPDVAEATVDVRVRFLQVQSRTVEQTLDGGSHFTPVDELHVGSNSWISWHEAVEREAGYEVAAADLLGGCRKPVDVAGGQDVELLRDGSGAIAGRIVRTRWALSGVLDLELAAASVTGRDLFTLKAHLANVTSLQADSTTAPTRGAQRDMAARYSLVGTHLLLAVRGATFVSLRDPPAWAADAAAACANQRCWPVLFGSTEQPDVVLVSPIILDDFPAIAPESPGELFDSTEIDEILTLRVMTLTDEEKQAARATDPRAAAIIDRCDQMPPEVLERLHGEVRSVGEDPAQVPWWDPEADASVAPLTDAVQIGSVMVAKGSRVRLRPQRRADAQDLFLADRTAVVARVDSDVDGQTHVAVLLEDDPASDLHEWYGRYYYFGPEEIEPLQPRRASAESGTAK
ncbi:MAG: hypothetical protein ABI586_00875 [Candidatus Nanopelagicales bacterium]